MLSPVKNHGIRSDELGSGLYMMPRGDHRHKGLDLVTTPGEEVIAPIPGRISKIGYCYNTEPQYRYIEILGDLLSMRLLYVKPSVGVGQRVAEGQKIGVSDDVSKKYGEQMTPHIHIEVRALMDPIIFLER